MTGADPTPDVPWDELRRRATTMLDRSYAPYSGVRVGAAALCEDGRIFAGCNVENASLGISICAEVNLVGSMVSAGGSRPLAISVVAGDGLPIAPCGRCRQFLHEFGGDELLIDRGDRPVPLGELLPDAFGPDDVAHRTG